MVTYGHNCVPGCFFHIFALYLPFGKKCRSAPASAGRNPEGGPTFRPSPGPRLAGAQEANIKNHILKDTFVV